MPGFSDFLTTSTTASPDFPGTGANGSEDSLFGVSKALAVYPVQLQPVTPSSSDVVAEYKAKQSVVPYESALALMYRMDPDKLVHLQGQLYEGGFYDATATFSPGVPDDETYKAYTKAVKRAARSGRAISDVLADSQAAMQAAGGVDALRKSKKGPLTVTLTDPADLRAVIEAGATKVYGRSKVDPAVIDRIVAAYHAAERTAQEATYTDAGTVTAPPNPASFVTEQLRAADPQQAAQNATLGTRDEFLRLLGATNA